MFLARPIFSVLNALIMGSDVLISSLVVMAKRLFKKREGPYSRLERLYPAIVLLLLFLVPLLFTLDNPFFLLTFLTLIFAMFGIVKPFIVCATCKQTYCFGKALSNKLKR
jgi:uncharacterized membrane protein